MKFSIVNRGDRTGDVVSIRSLKEVKITKSGTVSKKIVGKSLLHVRAARGEVIDVESQGTVEIVFEPEITDGDRYRGEPQVTVTEPCEVSQQVQVD